MAGKTTNLERVYLRTRPLLRAPRFERKAKLRQLDEELEGARSLVAGLGRPSWSMVQDNLWGGRMVLQSARVLAAAHIYRIERGRFPDELGQLDPILGGVPQDLLGGGPLRFSYDEATGGLRCYSVGENGRDDWGSASQRQHDDWGVETRAPGR